MIWLPVLAVAAVAFLAAALVLRMPRQSYTLLGAALLFGLAGYAVQGRPGQPAAPGTAAPRPAELGEMFVVARRALYDPASLPSRFLITSDAYARRGDEVRAAAFARSAVLENPGDSEAWTALGNALSQHAEGRLTPAAIYAFAQAERTARGLPAPAYFHGLALLRDGQPEAAREVWAELLAGAPADATWRAGIADRLARLDAMLGADR